MTPNQATNLYATLIQALEDAARINCRRIEADPGTWLGAATESNIEDTVPGLIRTGRAVMAIEAARSGKASPSVEYLIAAAPEMAAALADLKSQICSDYNPNPAAALQSAITRKVTALEHLQWQLIGQRTALAELERKIGEQSEELADLKRQAHEFEREVCNA